MFKKKRKRGAGRKTASVLVSKRDLEKVAVASAAEEGGKSEGEDGSGSEGGSKGVGAGPSAKKAKIGGFSSRAARTGARVDVGTGIGVVVDAASARSLSTPADGERGDEVAVDEATALKNKGLAHARLSSIRAKTLMDFDPLICKDYKDSGYCTFGETCKFIHDRSDYMAGWEIEDAVEKAGGDPAAVERGLMAPGARGTGMELTAFLESVKGRKTRARKAKGAFDAHDVPEGACPICQSELVAPMATSCGHTFCQSCILAAFRVSTLCPVCSVQTNGALRTAPPHAPR